MWKSKIFLLLEIFPRRQDKVELEQQNNHRGIAEGDDKVMKEPFSAIHGFAVFLADHPANTLVHHDQADYVGQPVADNKTWAEQRSMEDTYEPGEHISQRQIDKSVVPPGQRR